MAILSHGLEDNSRRGYMLGMCRVLRDLGLDCALRNFRGCGGASPPAVPGTVPLRGLNRIRTFARFDEGCTAPLNGFASAEDYRRRASSLPVLRAIRVPALLVHARNDSFLGPPCFPRDIAGVFELLFLEAPEHGGHLGFMTAPSKPLWSELRAAEFFRAYL